jgi:hypothetical protein
MFGKAVTKRLNIMDSHFMNIASLKTYLKSSYLELGGLYAVTKFEQLLLFKYIHISVILI